MELALDEVAGNLEVTWIDGGGGGGKSGFPFVWLRDNCRCLECFHPDAKCRKIGLGQLEVNVRARSAKTEVETPDSVKVTWDDGHVSVFTGSWLKRHRFDGGVGGQRSNGFTCGGYHRQPKLWTSSEFTQRMASFSFDDVLTYDEVLFDWITAIELDGLCLLTGAPDSPGQVLRMADRVAFLRPTHYGETFQVKDKRHPNNLAYTSAPLPLHTDLPYVSQVPGVQLLHCIKQCNSCSGKGGGEGGDEEGGDGRGRGLGGGGGGDGRGRGLGGEGGGGGGESQFTDGFSVAEQMRQEHPEFFQLLSGHKVDFCDLGTEQMTFHTIAQHHTIEVDLDSGRVTGVTFSNHTRDSVLRLPLDKVKVFYEALKTFDRLLNDPRNSVRLLLKPGDIACFHNNRILHGRTGYEVSIDDSNGRHLEGGYVDWDELLSRRRVIATKLKICGADIITCNDAGRHDNCFQ